MPLENTDDAYVNRIQLFYDTWKSAGNWLTDFERAGAKFLPGMWDAGVTMVTGLGMLILCFGYAGGIGYCVGSEPSEELEQKIIDTQNGLEEGVLLLFTDPMTLLEGIGQGMMDTYEEEGMAYATGYVGLELLVDIAGTKGIGKARTAVKGAGVRRAEEVVEQASDAANALDEVVDGGIGVFEGGVELIILVRKQNCFCQTNFMRRTFLVR